MKKLIIASILILAACGSTKEKPKDTTHIVPQDTIRTIDTTCTKTHQC